MVEGRLEQGPAQRERPVLKPVGHIAWKAVRSAAAPVLGPAAPILLSGPCAGDCYFTTSLARPTTLAGLPARSRPVTVTWYVPFLSRQVYRVHNQTLRFLM